MIRIEIPRSLEGWGTGIVVLILGVFFVGSTCLAESFGFVESSSAPNSHPAGEEVSMIPRSKSMLKQDLNRFRELAIAEFNVLMESRKGEDESDEDVQSAKDQVQGKLDQIMAQIDALNATKQQVDELEVMMKDAQVKTNEILEQLRAGEMPTFD